MVRLHHVNPATHHLRRAEAKGDESPSESDSERAPRSLTEILHQVLIVARICKVLPEKTRTLHSLLPEFYAENQISTMNPPFNLLKLDYFRYEFVVVIVA